MISKYETNDLDSVVIDKEMVRERGWNLDGTIAIPTTCSYQATELAERTADIFHKNIIKRTPFVKDRVFEVYPHIGLEIKWLLNWVQRNNIPPLDLTLQTTCR